MTIYWNLIHALRICRSAWFEQRYLCAACDSGVLD
jgi:hypothetical protein